MQSPCFIKKLSKLFYLHFSCKKVAETSSKENLKAIKNTLPNKSGNPENLKKKMVMTFGKLSTNVHIVVEDLMRAFYKLFCLLFWVSSDQWKTVCSKDFKRNLREIFMIIMVASYNSYKFNYRFAFIPFLSFRRNQKQESNFQQVGDLLTRSISLLV